MVPSRWPRVFTGRRLGADQASLRPRRWTACKSLWERILALAQVKSETGQSLLPGCPGLVRLVLFPRADIKGRLRDPFGQGTLAPLGPTPCGDLAWRALRALALEEK